MGTIGEHFESTSKDVEILKSDIAIFTNLIKEHKYSLDLLRELLSNAGAKEVGATKIEISYTKDREGHIFEIKDNGCGMNYTGKQSIPGRLDRFLGLGMSAIVGVESDEFSWKGLGSKLAYQSRRIEIETKFGQYPLYDVRVNEPWESLQHNQLPKPRISDYPNSDAPSGTKIRVVGYPPHRQEKPFTLPEIKDYLLHRTFAGFTKNRESPPVISLSVLGNEEVLQFGFPEFRDIDWPKGIFFDRDHNRLLVNIIKDFPKIGIVVLKGFLAWDAERLGLEKSGLNSGLILSSRGIPYFELPMEEYGARSILRGFPGKGGTCLVVESDRISTEMNISRSDLVDSAETVLFKEAVKNLLETLETSQEYLEKFRSIPATKKLQESATHLSEQKRLMESEDQNWVILQRDGKESVLLMREPQNESEVNALIWKMEALEALPFEKFQSLGYIGAKRGPDLLVNFQEDKDSEPYRGIVIEIENKFYSYTAHGHYSAQYPKVICWDAPTQGRKDRLSPTNRKYKFTITKDEFQVHVFILKQFDGIRVVSRREFERVGIKL